MSPNFPWLLFLQRRDTLYGGKTSRHRVIETRCMLRQNTYNTTNYSRLDYELLLSIIVVAALRHVRLSTGQELLMVRSTTIGRSSYLCHLDLEGYYCRSWKFLSPNAGGTYLQNTLRITTRKNHRGEYQHLVVWTFLPQVSKHTRTDAYLFCNAEVKTRLNASARYK